MKKNRNHIKVITKEELSNILTDKNRYKEGLAIWSEDVMIRSYLEDKDYQVLYRENTPYHRGFDFITKYLPTQQIIISEMKMTKKVGRLKTYLKNTKTKGRQMSIKWIVKTAKEIETKYPSVYTEIMNALSKGLLIRALYVTNHAKRPKGWQSASFGEMGMKGFYEKDFRNTPGFE